MANINAFPTADVTSMAEFTGFTLTEIQAPGFTDENLVGLMNSFYAGDLTPIVNPGQGIRSPEAVAELEAKLSEKGGVGGLLGFLVDLGNEIQDTTKKVIEPLAATLAVSPLILLAGITLAILLLARKGKA